MVTHPHELLIRSIGVAFESAGVLFIVARIAIHRHVWNRLRRRYLRLVGRPQSFTLPIEPAAHLTISGKRAYIDIRPGPNAEPADHVKSLWKSVDTLRERIEDTNADLRADIGKVNDRIAKESDSQQTSAKQTRSQLVAITRGDWFDALSVVCILLGILIANYSNEIAGLLAR